MNLAVNARNAMPGGGTLSIDTTNADVDDITASSLVPGRYVRLRISDPTASETAGPATTSAIAALPAESPHATILLVEDEDALRQVAARILTRAGYDVVAAACGTEAIHIAQTHPAAIDLLLTDVIMPHMSGNEVAERIHTIRPHTPVLYMSGYARLVLTETGTLEDGVMIIEKPFSSRELLDRIRALLHETAAVTP